MSTAYHPQTDGASERMNQEIEAYLRIYCTNNPDSWRRHLPTLEFAHNQREHSVTKRSPFYLMTGVEPKTFPLAYEPAAEDQLLSLRKARDEALATHELARQKMAERIR